MTSQTNFFDLVDQKQPPSPSDHELIDSFQQEIMADSEILRRVEAFLYSYQNKAQEVLKRTVDPEQIRLGYSARLIDEIKASLWTLIQKQYQDSINHLRKILDQNNKFADQSQRLDLNSDPIALLTTLKLVSKLERMLNFERVTIPNIHDIIKLYKATQRLELESENQNSVKVEIPIDSDLDALDQTKRFIDICNTLGIEISYRRNSTYLRLLIELPKSQENISELMSILKHFGVEVEQEG